MKKTYLMFALLLSLMGVNGALAATVTDDFTSYSATSSGQTLGDNWYVYPGDDGSFGRFGSDYTYKKNDYDGADYNYVSGYSSNYNKNVWLVLKKQVSGSVIFRSKMGRNSGTIYVTNKVTAVGDGTFTVDKTGAQSYSISTTTSSNTYSAGDAATYVAFCIASDQLRLLDVTYTEFEKSDGPALKVSGATDGALNFGMVNPGATKTLTLSNPGTKNITVGIVTTGGFTANPTSATIAAGEQQTLTISAPEATATGKVTITPNPAVEGIAPVEIALSCVVKDPSKVFVDFADGAMPDGWSNVIIGGYGNGWAVQTGYAYHTNSASSYYYAALTSPKLTFAEGEKLLFDVAKYGTSTWNTSMVKVQTSADGTTWTDVYETPQSALVYGSWSSQSVTMAAGSYYVRFYGGYATITNIYGGELPMEANMKVTGSDHNFGLISTEATTTFNIKNSGLAELTGITVECDNAAFAVSGVPSSLAAGADADVTIALQTEVKGVQNGVITIKADGQETVTLNIAGYVADGSKIYETFNALPANWQNTGWSFSGGVATGSYTSATASNNSEMITTPITVAEGETMAIEAKGNGSYSELYVYTSADNGNTWTKVGDFNTLMRANTSDYTVAVLSGVAAGNYRLKFEGYSVSVKAINGFTYNADAPELSLDNTTAAFGTVKAQPEDKQFTVTNSGTGTLSVAIASDSEDFTVAPATLEDIAAGESKTFTVHFNFAEPWGEKTANITVTPSYDPTAAVTITASATSKDPNVWDEDFEEGSIPETWTNEGGWTVSTPTASGNNGTKMATISSYNNPKTLTTPRLAAKAGDVLSFYIGMQYDDEPLTIEYSNDDRATWNVIEDGVASYTASGDIAFTAPADGKYFLRFTGTFAMLDNFSGFKLDLPAADAVITASSLPATGNQFVAYNASVTVENKGTEAQVAVAKLLVNGEEKYSQEAELAVAASATIDLSFVPEEAITDGTATIEVTLKGVEDFAAKKVEAPINIAAAPVIDETAENSFTTGILPVAVLNYTAKNGWNTIGVPFQLTNDILTTIFGEGWKAYELTGYSNNEISFSQTTTFVAGYPYIIYAEAAPQEASFKLENLNISSATEREDVRGGLAFRSTFAPIAPGQLTEWWGVTNQGRIQPAGSGASLKALRGYFYMNAAAPETNLSEARIVYINLDGTVTAISSVKAQLKADGNTYDLSGRKLTGNLKQGVYIQNGKKIVIK